MLADVIRIRTPCDCGGLDRICLVADIADASLARWPGCDASLARWPGCDVRFWDLTEAEKTERGFTNKGPVVLSLVAISTEGQAAFRARDGGEGGSGGGRGDYKVCVDDEVSSGNAGSDDDRMCLFTSWQGSPTGHQHKHVFDQRERE